MRDLQSGDIGMYFCAVEIGGLTEPDVKEDFYITVKSDPDVSVLESSVSATTAVASFSATEKTNTSEATSGSAIVTTKTESATDLEQFCVARK
ncbi:hypothetical protein SRHO_G00239190 [Serrasalmus rhombeus]